MEVFSQLILNVIMIFMVIAAMDRIFSQFGGSEKILGKIHLSWVGRAIADSGKEFENGFLAMGSLGLAMIGMMALAPTIAKLLGPFIIPIYTALGASPAMFATSLLANDMGGYFLAKELATVDGVTDIASWLFAGLILGAMLGPTLVFTLPVALNIIEEKDQYYLAFGALIGIVTIPLGCLAGGITAIYSHVIVDSKPVAFTYQMLLFNLLPVSLLALLIALGLWFFPNKVIKGFNVFAKIILVIITIGLVSAVLEATVGWGFIPGMAPIFMTPSDTPGEVIRAFEIVGRITCILLGAYPMVFLLTKWFAKPLGQIGAKLKINQYSATGLIATLANNIPMFSLMKLMDERGKVINVAFTVSAAFTFGDHLGFTAANMPQMIFPVIIGKLVGGFTALILALCLLSNFTMQKSSSVKEINSTADDR